MKNTYTLCLKLSLFTFGLTHFSFADITNEGFIGDSFYGVISDSSSLIVNQVGPNAKFSVPTKLNVHSELSSLLSGEFSKLTASISLDDGTTTQLPTLSTQWESASTELLIKDDFATAQNISANSRVSIKATAEGMSAIFFIRLKNNTSGSTQSKDPVDSPKNALSDSVALPQAGWKNSAWFGNYYEGGNDWVHHAKLGWLYTSKEQPSALWLWSSSQEWLWTGPEVYPHLFRNRDGTWIYYIIEAYPQKVFYNQSTKKLELSQ
ncbi:MAG: hypothetical protein P8O23_05410 [Opitutales bacterium]|nr:hypothetical protein [Opitutales bacterium]